MPHDNVRSITGHGRPVSRTPGRLVGVEFDPSPVWPEWSEAYLGPDSNGNETLFVHLHLARDAAQETEAPRSRWLPRRPRQLSMPAIRRVYDLETGETIPVSGSWLGNGGFYD